MNFTKLALTLSLTAVYAGAFDKTFVEQTVQSARNLQRDAVVVSTAVKNKKADATEVKQKIDAMSADIAKLQELVAQFEASAPQLNEAEQAEWQLIKDKVRLLEIFYQQKKKLAEEDLTGNRTMIRAHARGVAERAEKLQQRVTKLMKTRVS